MDPVTHAAAGLVISQALPSPSSRAGAWAGVAFALLPDIDYFLVFIDRLAFIRHHRGLTHGLLALPVLAFLGALLGRALGGPRWFKPLFWLGLAALGSHLLLDWAGSYGTQLLSPFSDARFSLDWMFIIDPVFTLILVAGGLAARRMTRSCQAAWVTLTLAAAYFLLCGFYHQQALAAARQIFTPPGQPQVQVAALPQPLSNRRWHLLAWRPTEVRQAFLSLPITGLGATPARVASETAPQPAHLNPRAPDVTFQPPQRLEVLTWRGEVWPERCLSGEAQTVLDTYRYFARYPLLLKSEHTPGKLELTWMDLRFTVPGRSFPFVFRLTLDDHGRLAAWNLGHGGLPRASAEKINTP